MIKYYIVMAVAVVTGFYLALSVSGPTARVWDQAGSGQAQIGGPFQLVDQTGHLQTESLLQGKISLVYFGYTYCPDICPMGLLNMARAVKQLDPAQGPDVQLIFVTVDPGRDTAPQLKTYLESYPAPIIGLTGDVAHVQQAIQAYKVYAARAAEDRGSTDYLMDHSTLIYLMDRQGRFCESMPHTTDPATIKAAILKHFP